MKKLVVELLYPIASAIGHPEAEPAELVRLAAAEIVALRGELRRTTAECDRARAMVRRLDSCPSGTWIAPSEIEEALADEPRP